MFNILQDRKKMFSQSVIYLLHRPSSLKSTFISIPITEEYNSTTNDQSWEDKAIADIVLF